LVSVIAVENGKGYIDANFPRPRQNPTLVQGEETMKKLLWTALVPLLMPMMAAAQNSIDGTWRFDLKTAELPKKPDVFLLQGGVYECKTCVPPINVKADGQDHQVTGSPYFDTVSIKVLDDRTIEETDKKGSKTVTTSKSSVSPDGKTLNFTFTDSSATNAEPVTGEGEATRVVKAPAGAHAISGSWRTSKFENISANALSVTYKVDGDTLTMSNPTGQGYTAKLDGTEAPYKGDPGTTSVSVKEMGKNVIEETDKRDGKVISVARITVAPDGKSMTLAVTDKLRGTTSEFKADKQ
jgi:hypothetical protein